MSAIPIIDISPLFDGSFAGLASVSASIGEACRNTGFFCITGHNVPADLVARVFHHSAAFFAAPDSVRASVAFTGPGGNRGYIAAGAEQLDPSRPADIKEAFNIGLELAPDDPDLVARRPFRVPNLWPDLPDFREVMLDYFNRLWALGLQVHRAFATDLGLPPDHFGDKFSKPLATLRLLHYPPVAAHSDGGLGAGAHTDYGNLTLLATDDVGGLMVQDRSGAWIDVPFVPGAFVCNIGDCLMRWTNDVYVSTPHRVVSPRNAHRYSVAFFLDPDPDAIVECLPTCTGPGNPAKYPPVTGADFLLSRLSPTYAGAPRRAP